MLKNQRLHHFGDFSLELDPPTLRRGLEILKLPHRQMEILCLLIAAQGGPVPKAAFFDQVWSGSFVEEGNLTQTVFLLRRALGKLPDGGEYIETLPRLGYRIAPIALSMTSRESGIRPTTLAPRTEQPHMHPRQEPEAARLSSSVALKDFMPAVLQSHWEPVFWIGIGMLVSLFAVLVALVSVAYVKKVAPVPHAERTSLAVHLVSTAPKPL